VHQPEIQCNENDTRYKNEQIYNYLFRIIICSDFLKMFSSVKFLYVMYSFKLLSKLQDTKYEDLHKRN
jgi:hypothetical protein